MRKSRRVYEKMGDSGELGFLYNNREHQLYRFLHIFNLENTADDKSMK